TVRPTEVVCVSVPLVPVTVTVAAPSVAVADAVRVSVDELAVVEPGLNAAVTPVGGRLAVKATLPVKPPVRVIVTVLVPLAPRFTVSVAGLADSEKSGVAGAFTVSPMAAVRVRPPPVPVTVTVDRPVVAVLEAV